MTELTNHPDWSPAPGASDVFIYRRNPDITLGPEEQGSGPYSLTDGSGSVFYQGTVAELLEIAVLFAERPSNPHILCDHEAGDCYLQYDDRYTEEDGE